jgi:hypothetical protein
MQKQGELKSYAEYAKECLETCGPDVAYEDYNGSLFVSGGQGEAEDCNPVDIAWALQEPDLPEGIKYPLSQTLATGIKQAILTRTYLLNFYYLIKYTA